MTVVLLPLELEDVKQFKHDMQEAFQKGAELEIDEITQRKFCLKQISINRLIKLVMLCFYVMWIEKFDRSKATAIDIKVEILLLKIRRTCFPHFCLRVFFFYGKPNRSSYSLTLSSPRQVIQIRLPHISHSYQFQSFGKRFLHF